MHQKGINMKSKLYKNLACPVQPQKHIITYDDLEFTRIGIHNHMVKREIGFITGDLPPRLTRKP